MLPYGQRSGEVQPPLQVCALKLLTPQLFTEQSWHPPACKFCLTAGVATYGAILKRAPSLEHSFRYL